MLDLSSSGVFSALSDCFQDSESPDELRSSLFGEVKVSLFWTVPVTNSFFNNQYYKVDDKIFNKFFKIIFSIVMNFW